MQTTRSSIGIEQLTTVITSQDGTLALAMFEELESEAPSKTTLQMLNKLLPKLTDPILAFQGRKTLQLLNIKKAGPIPDVPSEKILELAQEAENMEELALAMSCTSPTDGFLAVDFFREKDWSDFESPILPTLCSFFKKYGSNSDAPKLIELTRHPDSTVVTAALNALEVVDPSNLQSLVTPLLDSPFPGIRAKAVQTIYRWNKVLAIQHFVSMLFSENPMERTLALFHSRYFPFPEVEPHLLRFIAEVSDPQQLLQVNQTLKRNAHPELPFKIYWIFRSLRGEHQNLVKGIVIGLVRTLSEKKVIDCSPEDFLKQLKVRIKEEEERRLRASMVIDPDDQETSNELAQVIAEDNTVSTEPSPVSVTSSSTKTARYFTIQEYEKIDLSDRVQMLAKISREDYREFNSKIPGLLKTASGKELAAIVRAIGKFGSQEDSEKLKKFLSSDNPDLICAGIDALSNLDPDYLAIFLPQLMQSKNGKIRIKATKAFSKIDNSQIKSLIKGMLKSPSPKQRSMAVTISTLVDFSLVRGPLLTALEKEINPDILEKMGFLLCNNPDRELFRTVFRLQKVAPKDSEEALKKMVLQLSQTLSVALDKISSPEELMAAEEQALAEETAVQEKETKEGKETAVAEAQKEAFKDFLKRKGEQKDGWFLTSENPLAKEKRANLTVALFLLAGFGWTAMILSIFLDG